ncbi:hypothetical protein EUGRSUZ_B04040 [Eucalyptus grandis]|uniref:Uncharacterized protein n=2 Tax=Eucalyptus grandis TaxID=71139 RepID=A0ACC3LZS8_EUCGR|nr:hypothetical protein EUGRSUZ_B04040 [Eucalyptus grandis]
MSLQIPRHNSFSRLVKLFDSQGDIYNQKSLLSAIKQVDVVISTARQGQLEDQDRIVAAIKAAGNIKVVSCLVIKFRVIIVCLAFD